MKAVRVVLVFFLLFTSGLSAFGQQGCAITVLSAKDSSAISGAICVFQSLQKPGKQLVLVTDKNGKIFYTGNIASLLTIQSQGYKTFADTILPNHAFTIRLQLQNVNLDEVVITGQYSINTSDKSVYSVKVIDSKEIAARSATSLDQLLSSELNIRLAEDNILGSSVTINGLSGQNVKIMIDGVPMIGRENGNIDLSQINLNNIERVEIIEGPMSVMYGTDAIGGIINLITKQGGTHKVEGNLNLDYETVGIYNVDGSVVLKQKSSSLTLSGGRYFFGGFSNPDTGRSQQWKPWEQYFGAVAYGFKTRMIDGVLKVDYFHQLTENNGDAVISPYSAYALDEYYKTDRLNVSLFNSIRLPNSATIQLTNAYSYYQRIDNSYYTDLTTLTKSLIDQAGEQDTSWFSNFLFRGTYSKTALSKLYSFQAGYDINLQGGGGFDILNEHQFINDYAAFGSVQLNLHKFQVMPGLRLSYNTRYGAPVIPSLNLKYDANNKLQFRASYSRGFRAPSLQELDLDFVDADHNIHGNADLKAEHSDHYNFSISYLSKINTNDIIKLNYNIFYNNISNIITLAETDNSTSFYTYINVDKYKTLGNSVDVQLKSGMVTLGTGFSLTGLYNSVAAQYPGVDEFSFTPEFTANAAIHFPKLNADISLYVKNTGSTPGFAVNSTQQVYPVTVGSYTIMDLILQKSVLKGRLKFSSGIKNLLNVINIISTVPGGIHSDNNGFLPYTTGRNFFIKLNFKIYK